MVSHTNFNLNVNEDFIIFWLPWAQGGPRGDTQDLWRHWWKGPSDPNVGEGLGRWKRLPPTGTRSHEGKAMIYT